LKKKKGKPPSPIVKETAHKGGTQKKRGRGRSEIKRKHTKSGRFLVLNTQRLRGKTRKTRGGWWGESKRCIVKKKDAKFGIGKEEVKKLRRGKST